MVSETVISALFEASLTGMGLVLAVYALLTPISKGIFEQRAKILRELIKKFNEEHSKLTAEDSSEDDWKRHEQKRKEINKIKVLPRYFGIGIFVAFTFFSVSFLVSMFWLGSETYHVFPTEFSIFAFCSLGWLSFVFVGVSIIAEVADSLTKKFEDIKDKQKEVQKKSGKK
jgi:pilus assembly protein TadC